MSEPVLSVRDLVTEFRTSEGVVHAVDHVSFELYPGETLGIVGESGSGKSATVLSALGLIPKSDGRVVGGQVLLRGTDLLTLPPRRLRRIRGRDIAMVFQDPMTSLNPVFTVGAQLVEAIRLHQPDVRAAPARRRAVETLALVGVPNPEARFEQYPHEYSGGMRQRAMIAMAIINDPAVLIADEPTTALDVTIQAQVLDALRKAQRDTGSASIVITHDLGVVAEMADRVLVMYGGRVVESGRVEEIFRRPRHPYTAGLLSSMPQVRDAERLTPIPGDAPNLIELPGGCSFHPRCAVALGRGRCTQEKPRLYEAGGAGHLAACHFWAEVPARSTASPAGSAAPGSHARQEPLDVESLDRELADPDPAGPEPAGPEPAGSVPAGSVPVGPGLAGSERVGPELAGPELAGSERVGPELAGPELAGPELAGAEPAVGEAAALEAEASGPRAPGGPAASTAGPLLSVKGLVKHFPAGSGLLSRRRDPVRAVEGVSFELYSGETLGLVGESGSGKTTVGKAIIGLVGEVDGTIAFLGRDIGDDGRRRLREVRRDLQMVFQDPYSSLDPRMKVSRIIEEPLRIHRQLAGHRARARASELLEQVGLPAGFADRHPHQLSGGQRQRVGIARALALNPRVLVLDEPVSALDVSVQAQVINLLEDLQDELGLAYLFIAHDLSVVHHVSDRVAVMYLGKIMEVGDKHAIYAKPTHPYTQALLSAVPVPDPAQRDRRDRILLRGDIPSPSNPPSGCVFRTRCWKADDTCAAEVPALADRLGVGHASACHHPDLPAQAGRDGPE